MAEQDGCFIFVFGVLVRRGGCFIPVFGVIVRREGVLFVFLVSWRDGKAKKRRGSYQ